MGTPETGGLGLSFGAMKLDALVVAHLHGDHRDNFLAIFLAKAMESVAL